MRQITSRATAIAPAGSFAAADTVVLDREDRHRRRMAMTAVGGLAFVLDLADATVLEDGDGLILEDGRVVLVRAAEEDVVAITAASQSELVRIAWHLGNRHLPTELQPDRLVIRRDHVIEAMVAGLGGRLAPGRAPFRPEGGAYGPGAVHGHDHPHDHAHPHDHGHAHHHDDDDDHHRHDRHGGAHRPGQGGGHPHEGDESARSDSSAGRHDRAAIGQHRHPRHDRDAGHAAAADHRHHGGDSSAHGGHGPHHFHDGDHHHRDGDDHHGHGRPGDHAQRS